MMKAVALSFAFLLSAGTAFAHHDDSHGSLTKVETGIDDRLQVSAQAGSPQPGDEIATGTPTFTERHGMSGPSMNQGKGNAAQHPQPMDFPPEHGLSGIVTSIGANSFTMTVTSVKNATTTVTVASSTKFVRASGTASLADLQVGSKVVVTGTRGSAAKSVIATRVVIAGDGMHTGEVRRIPALLERLRDFFLGRHSGTDARVDTEAHAEASASSSGFITKLGALFGWL